MSILQTILQDQQAPESPLLITPAEKLLWDGIVEKDIKKIEQSIKIGNGVPPVSYDLLRACVKYFDPQICERFFPKHQVHALDEDDAILLLQSADTTQAFLPSLVALSNTLILERGYFSSNFSRVFYWAGSNLALVLQEPQCNVLQNLQKYEEEKNFVTWAIRSCQPLLLETAQIDWNKYSTGLRYTLPTFETLQQLSQCQQFWEQQLPQHQDMLQKLLAPMHDFFPTSFGGDPWLTAYIVHDMRLMSQIVSSVEGCQYVQKMLDVSEQLGCRENLMDILLHTLQFEIHLDKKMNFKEYAQLLKICAKCNGSQGENVGVKMLLNGHAFHEKLVTKDEYQNDYEDEDDDDDERESKEGAYGDDDFFTLLRATVYWCEDEIVEVIDSYSKSWKPSAQKMIYEKHVGALGCEKTKKKM